MAGWELIEGGIDSDLNRATERLEVPGGWLYRSVWRHQHTRFTGQDGCGVAFVPRPAPDGAVMAQVQMQLQAAAQVAAQGPQNTGFPGAHPPADPTTNEPPEQP